MSFQPPQDIVAIFHTSFHPTKGNVLDWHFSSDDGLDVENLGLEFSALPSGLHQLDEDVIYFTAKGVRKGEPTSPPQTYHALALFRRRRTAHPLYRGFLLGSLGILVADTGDESSRPRPWRHLAALRTVAERCYSRPGSEPNTNTAGEGTLVDLGSSDEEKWYKPAQEFFEERRIKTTSIPEHSARWQDELYDELRYWIRSTEPGSSCPEHQPTSVSSTLTHISPTLAVPSLLTLLGPASLTLYRHLLSRKRMLIYTKPPVEYACVLCYAAADMVRNIQEGPNWSQALYTDDEDKATLLQPRHTPGHPTRVLGMVTLHDLLGTKLTEEEGEGGDLDEEAPRSRGWIACTTDALFLEKPSYYDLLIDLTSVGVSSSSTIAFTTSKSAPQIARSPSTGSTASWMFGSISGSNSGSGIRPRPTMYISVPKHPTPHVPAISSSKSKSKGKKKTATKKVTQYKRIQTRWAWSDARLWAELDRVLRAPAVPESTQGDSNDADTDRPPVLGEIGGGSGHAKCKSCGAHVGVVPVDREPSSSGDTPEETTPTPGGYSDEKANILASSAAAWMAEVWQLYEDVCLACAGAWMGTLRTRNAGLGGLGEREGYATAGNEALFGGSSSGYGSTLKRSVSTPNRGASGSQAGGSLYSSSTMPSTRSKGKGHAHNRSASAGGVMDMKKMAGFDVILEEALNVDTNLSAVASAGEQHDHDFTLVAPPTPDTREGLDILLNTASLKAALPPNLNLSEAVSKTEGVLAVLDGYASTMVGILRRRAMDEVGTAASAEGDSDTESESNAENDTAAGVDTIPGARTSAIELTSATASRRSPPPSHTQPGEGRSISQGTAKTSGARVREMNMTLTPRDLLSLDLNPLSMADVKYLECVQREYASRARVVATGSRSREASSASGPGDVLAGLGGVESPVEVGPNGDGGVVLEEVNINLVVKRGWKDLVGVVFGL